MPSLVPIRRIVVTGSSGLCGRALVRAIRRTFPEAQMLGLDIAPPSSDPPDDFVQGSIVDADLSEILRRFNADTVVHLAYMVEPSRDHARMREVNVTGSERILAAVVEADVSRVVVSSSATAYGPCPENALPRREDAPLQPYPAFTYAAHKGEVETMLATFAAAHPEIAVAWTRPAIVCAAGDKNFLSDIFLTVPFMVLPGGRDTPLQFVHADDLADATLAILSAGGRGPYNVAPPDALTQRDLAAMMGIRAVSLPTWLVTAAARVWWTLRLPWLRTPPGLTAYLSHPWLVDSSKLTADCGFSFRYSGRQAFATLLPEAVAPSHAE